MENKDNLRRYLIYILKNAEIYYITKNKVEREVYRLDQIESEIRKENDLINSLFAVKNDDIRMKGQTSPRVEELLTICSNNVAYYFGQKSRGNYININDDSTLEEIADNIRRICNDEIIDREVHELTEEEALFDSLYVKELKFVSEKGLVEEERYIKEKYKETKQKEEEVRRQYEEDIELSDNEEIAPEDSLIYKLRRARKQGIEAERLFLGQK